MDVNRIGRDEHQWFERKPLNRSYMLFARLLHLSGLKGQKYLAPGKRSDTLGLVRLMLPRPARAKVYMISQLSDYTFAPIGRWLTLTFLPRVSLRLPGAKYFWPFRPCTRQNPEQAVQVAESRTGRASDKIQSRPCKRQSLVLAVQATKSIAGSASDEDDCQ